MNISVDSSIYIYSTLIIMVINFFLSHKEKNIIKPFAKKFYILRNSFISFIGFISIFLLRYELCGRLDSPWLEESFVNWCLQKYDVFYQISIISILIIGMCLILLLLFYKKYKCKIIMNIYVLIIIFALVGILLASIIYTFTTINKIVNLGLYIFSLSIFEVCLLHIVFVVKRIVLNNMEVRIKEK